jgi:uncharacterized protein
MNAFVIDAFEFCRLKERREGEIAVAELPRLAEESVDKAGTLQWSLQGGNDQRGHAQMVLSVSGAVNLVCQRCLAPFPFQIASDSTVVLAPDEGSADEIDAQLADEPVEVVVGSRNFDIAQLIEDEALLAIPLSPKHEVCPGQVGSGAVDAQTAPDAGKPSPFAILKNLKK